MAAIVGAVADACDAPSNAQSAGRGLRIGGLFIIAVVSSFGVILPLVLGRRFKSAFFLARTFGAGVIISTAFVHVLADASSDLFSPCLGWSSEYPWGNAIASGAVLLTFAMEYSLGHLFRARLGCSTTLTSQAPAGLATPIHPGATAEDLEDPASIAEEKAAALARLDATVASYSLESGIVIHSIFIGLSYGTETDYGVIRALTIALGFHQGIEGISLACTFLDAGYSRLKYALFSAVFVLITPIGIGIGLGVGNAYHEGSKTALGVQGTLNAVSAGILLYNGIVDLLLPAFGYGGHSHSGVSGAAPKRGTALKLAGFFSLFCGCALQALIGKWA